MTGIERHWQEEDLRLQKEAAAKMSQEKARRDKRIAELRLQIAPQIEELRTLGYHLECRTDFAVIPPYAYMQQVQASMQTGLANTRNLGIPRLGIGLSPFVVGL